MILIMPGKEKLLYRFAMCFDCVNRNFIFAEVKYEF